MKPIITVYTTDGPEQTKKFDGFISAAFWVGVDHTEGEVTSVKIRLPTESYDTDVANVLEFTTLLVQREINFSVEFFSEPRPEAIPRAEPVTVQTPEGLAKGNEQSGDYRVELDELKAELERGQISKKQYEAKKGAVLRRWKERVEGRLET